MASIINEEKLVNDNISQFENRMKTQSIRFIDHTQTYVTLMHISNQDSTVDDGFLDIESLVGARSPFRYQKILHFPIYGLDAVVPQLQENDWGLDSEAEGDAIVLPNTIKPLQNDFFIIEHVDRPFIFRITEVSYDNIRPDNYYQIHYRLEFIDENRLQMIESKVIETFECVMENIGSEERCIIKSSDMGYIKQIKNMISDIAQSYLYLFYDDTHNSLITYTNYGKRLYDQYLNHFVNIHKLLEVNQSIKSYMMTDQFCDHRFQVKYERSFYRVIERRDVSLINPFPYNLFIAGANPNSTFSTYYDHETLAVDLLPEYRGVTTNGMRYLLSDEIIKKIKEKHLGESSEMDLIIKYLHRDEIKVQDVDMDMHRQLLSLDRNEELYWFMPVIIYILKDILKQH